MTSLAGATPTQADARRLHPTIHFAASKYRRTATSFSLVSYAGWTAILTLPLRSVPSSSFLPLLPLS